MAGAATARAVASWAVHQAALPANHSTNKACAPKNFIFECVFSGFFKKALPSPAKCLETLLLVHDFDNYPGFLRGLFRMIFGKNYI
jgi:hypothetical protein